MRTPFIAGNWKMNLGLEEACALARAVREMAAAQSDVNVAVAPAFTSLAAVRDVLQGSRVELAAQNCHHEASGAFTGEVSPEQLRDLGVGLVIIGHSERRQYFGETDTGVCKKIHAAHRAHLRSIVCVGETLAERQAGKTESVVAGQLKAALQGVPGGWVAELTMAYEPVWAIGTGKTATPAQAQEVHAMLRGILAELYGAALADQVRIQYGGSVNPGNICDLMAQPDIDGALVGGASLKADSFARLIRFKDSNP